jgi:uncharacterized damage-inducible protein DinB
MPLNEPLLTELKQESALSRKMLERVPFDIPDWKPHEKSMTMQRLSSHLAEMPAWMNRIIDNDEFDVASLASVRFLAKNQEELLKKFDESLAIATNTLQEASDAVLQGQWTMIREGKAIYTRPKLQLLRSFVFSHAIHHRGQLSVYLRLNDIPVPGMYGPSADER